eukprot:c15564_g1_i1.p1 GENE.c15564_g1_i1~~c15564_g1_i1.p1  ORF type:complete len:454 (+),score=231.76 c15564_g1_i1:3-1364(+)
MHVIVIGGGICGLSTAIELVQKGFTVSVLERSSFASTNGECASTVNCGLICSEGYVTNRSTQPQITTKSLKKMYLYSTLKTGSRDIYNDLQKDYDIEYEQRGCLVVGCNIQEMNSLRNGVENKKALGLEVEMIESKEGVKSKHNGLIGDNVLGAEWCPAGATANPRKSIRALTEKAKNYGVRLYPFHCVIDIKVTKCGNDEIKYNVSGFDGGNKGFNFGSDKLVLATGYSMKSLAMKVDPKLKSIINIIPVLGQMWATSPPHSSSSVIGQKKKNQQPSTPMVCAQESGYSWETHASTLVPPLVTHLSRNGKRITRHLYGKQAPDGTFMFGGDRRVIEDYDVSKSFYNPDIISDGIETNFRHVTELIPEIAKLGIQRTWSGIMPFCSDGLPLIGNPLKESDSFFVCGGMSSSGFMCGAMAGKLLAQGIANEGKFSDSLKVADPTRFAYENTSKI